MRALAVVLLAVGCGDSSTMTMGDMAVCPASEPPRCGAEPLQSFDVSMILLTPMQRELLPTQPISITNSRCAEVTTQTSCAGAYKYFTTADQLYYIKFTSPEIVNTIRGEVDAHFGGGFGRGHLWRKEIGPIVGLASDGPVLMIRAERTLPNLGACSELDGISFAIDGRPELTPTYYDTSDPPKPIANATATSTAGLASFKAGLTGGTTVMVSAQKAGCSVLTHRGNETGTRPLENGFLSMVPVTIGQ